MEIIKYTSDKKQEWDKFVSQSKNGTFLFYRDYMEYHSDRFEDYSLMIYDGTKLTALFPANIVNDTIYSHQGLTYGGVICDNQMRTPIMLNIFNEIIAFLKEIGISTLFYKCIPHIYHRYPSEEDLYALFRLKAKLIRRDISTTIKLTDRIEFNTLRKRKVKQALKAKLQVEEQYNAEMIYPLLENNLQEKHNTTPVHSKKELEFLKSKFPSHIKFFICKNSEGLPLAGAVIYNTIDICHIQYICSNKNGRKVGALDFLFNELINTKCIGKTYFDFGISTEQNGLFLNKGLINQKEMFGGRGICYDTYEISIS